jgi:hypothetical protein
MPWLRKKTRRPFFTVENGEKCSLHGGQLLIEALCQRLKVWDEFYESQLPNPTGRFLSQAIVAQLLFSFTMGVPISESSALFRREPVLLELLGLDSAADEATLRAWLEGQDWRSVRLLRGLTFNLLRNLVAERTAGNLPASVQVPRLVNFELVPRAVLKAAATRKTKASEKLQVESVALLPVVLADTEFPVRTPGASDGQTAGAQASWQTLSIGQFLVEAGWGQEIWEDTSSWAALRNLVTANRESWVNQEACFHYHHPPADLENDTSENQEFRKIIREAGFSMWTAPARFATEPRIDAYQRLSIGGEKWKRAESGDHFADEYGMLPLADGGGMVAAARSKGDKPEAYRYCFVPTGQAHQERACIFQLHASLEKRPKVVDEMLDGSALRRLPLDNPVGNAAYFALATLAFNLIVALRDLELPPELRDWPVLKIIREVLLAPATLVTGSRQRKIRIGFPECWLQPCQQLVDDYIPRPQRGRPRGWRKSNIVKAPNKRRRKRTPNLDPLPDVRPDSAPQAGGLAEDAARREPESF